MERSKLERDDFGRYVVESVSDLILFTFVLSGGGDRTKRRA